MLCWISGTMWYPASSASNRKTLGSILLKIQLQWIQPMYIMLAGKQKQIQCRQLPIQTHLGRQVAVALYPTIWLQHLTKCMFMRQEWSASRVSQLH